MITLFKRLVWWCLALVFFFAIFAFTLNNRESVEVRWFFGYTTRLQLVLLVLLVFTLGVAAGVAAMVPWWLRSQRNPPAPVLEPAAPQTPPVLTPAPAAGAPIAATPIFYPQQEHPDAV